MTTQDSSQVVVGANGQIFVAPTDTAAPTAVDDVLDVAFVELGFVSEDGATVTDSKTVENIGAWQSFYPIRRIVTAREFMVAFAMRQWNAENIPFAFGGGLVTSAATGGVHEVEVVTLASLGDTDTFKLTFNAVESAAITSDQTGPDTGTYNAAGIKAAIEGIAGFTATVTVSNVTNDGFLVTWNEAGAVASVLSEPGRDRRAFARARLAGRRQELPPVHPGWDGDGERRGQAGPQRCGRPGDHVLGDQRR
jgi:hypothetical protein